MRDDVALLNRLSQLSVTLSWATAGAVRPIQWQQLVKRRRQQPHLLSTGLVFTETQPW